MSDYVCDNHCGICSNQNCGKRITSMYLDIDTITAAAIRVDGKRLQRLGKLYQSIDALLGELTDMKDNLTPEELEALNDDSL